MRFSEEYGYKPVKNKIQLDDIDEDLRNSLWNVLELHLWSTHEYRALKDNRKLYFLFEMLWLHYFKQPLDTIPYAWDAAHSKIRHYFFTCAWFEVYDFIVSVAQFIIDDTIKQRFKESCNNFLERELSGYRFVGDKISPITSEEEIHEIEEALSPGDPFKPIGIHIQAALEKLSDRKSPDYRNSIKESISAVESICRLIAGSEATLGKALGEIQRQGKIGLHDSLRTAFDKLYSYTSDKDGIRHSLMDEPNLAFEDAKFMLVSCSAFINYLKVKSQKSGIQFKTK